MFYQIIKHGAKVKNHPPPPHPPTPIYWFSRSKSCISGLKIHIKKKKPHNWEEKVQMTAQLSFCGLRKLLVTKSSFEEFNDVSLPHGGVQNVLFLNSTKATNF